MEAGYYRLFLQSTSDADWLVVYLPLDEDGNYGAGPEPHLVKTLWDDHFSYGEFRFTGSEYNLIEWDGPAPDSLTELLTAPIRRGALVRVYQANEADAGSAYQFKLRDIQRL